MANSQVIQWNLGLGFALVFVILGFLTKLKLDFDAGKATKDDESNLVTLALMINAATVVYWMFFPCPEPQPKPR